MDPTPQQKLGLTIKRLRQDLGASQERFAQTTHIERSRYGKIERGELNISLKVLMRLAYHLQTTPSELLADLTILDCASAAGDSDVTS